MPTFARRIARGVWRVLRVLLIAGATAGPAAPPPPPPPPPPPTEQVFDGQVKDET